MRGAIALATTADVEDLRKLAEEFDRAVATRRNEAARAANFRFHQRMFELAGLPQTLHFVQILWARYPFDLINKIDRRVDRAATEHQELLEAFIAADAAAAIS